ncbi:MULTISPECIES: DUF4142 domain-containing protein [unclassified Streptomyces]|uniref:DUF4142 domain-containing protein n=1 Tax=Streptomyces sp. NBC_00060 TaxID=2975636 RepID=A0AAU2GTJ9_9ACTN
MRPIGRSGGGPRRATPGSLADNTPGGNVLVSKPVVTAGIVLALVATMVALVIPATLFKEPRALSTASTAAAGSPDDGLGTINTPFGPLTALDRDLMNRVRQAGLWELPSGAVAQKSTRAAVQEAGRHLIDGHTALDQDVLATAKALNWQVPDQPSAQQRGWLAQIQAAPPGDTADKLFVNLLRNAHGKVFTAVAQARSQSQNSLVRGLASRANNVVLDHMNILEATGLVDPVFAARLS